MVKKVSGILLLLVLLFNLVACSTSNSTKLTSLEGNQWLFVTTTYNGKSQDLRDDEEFLSFSEDGVAKVSWADDVGNFYDNDDDYSNGFNVNISGELMNAYIADDVLTLELQDGSMVMRLEKQ